MHSDVLLINMPFASLYRPSIGLSLLKAGLREAAISCDLQYLTIPFAERIGSRFYLRMSNQEPRPSDLLGEWIFAAGLNDRPADDQMEEFLHDVLSRKSGRYNEALFKEALNARQSVPPFLDECTERVLKRSPLIVGFTSVFNQHAAALALAKRIKTIAPETRIIFGGDNCEGIMGAELVRRFAFIDAVVSGEGDAVLPEIVKRWVAGKEVSEIPGVFTRDNVNACFLAGRFPSAARVEDLDQLPYPDYDDFFVAHHWSNLPKIYRYDVLFESSRGCWWGERSHCTFCGLSSEKMTYRSKSAQRAFEELQTLASRYPGCSVTSVDNIIDLKYFKDLVPQLAQQKLDLHLFYETKANLKKSQLRLMKEAGFKRIQPGIESFSNKILDRMGKGVKALQNIQLLKWCKEYGIRPYWNVLWGFPGEEAAEYKRMAKLIPLLSHLPAPQSAGPIRLDRFSPNFKNAEKLGLHDVEPFPAYSYIYDVPREALQNLAYYFTFGYADGRTPESYTKDLHAAIKDWWRDGKRSDLFFVDKQSHLLVWDFRHCAKDVLTILTDEHRDLYLACDSMQTLADLKRTTLHAEEILQPLLDRGLMVRDGNSVLALAIPLGEYKPNSFVLRRFHEAVMQLGSPDQEGLQIELAVA